MNFLKHLLTLSGFASLLGLATLAGSVEATLPAHDLQEKIEVEMHEVAPTTPSGGHVACTGECPPVC